MSEETPELYPDKKAPRYCRIESVILGRVSKIEFERGIGIDWDVLRVEHTGAESPMIIDLSPLREARIQVKEPEA